MATARNQPTYDFLSGEPTSPRAGEANLRHTLRQSTATTAMRPTAANEDLRAQLKTLEYEVASLKQDRELTALQHATDLRDAQARADADFRRAQTAEATAKAAATTRLDQLGRELADRQAQWADERAELERRARSAAGQREALREELEEVQEQLVTLEREGARQLEEVEARVRALSQSYEQSQEEVEAKTLALQTAQGRLALREDECGRLEADVLRLKASAGDAESVDILKRDLSEQVVHIRKLETENREQKGQLTDLRKNKKSIEMVEEEKHSLQTRLRVMENLRTELEEVRLRNEALENEKNAWTSYLDVQSSADESDMHFESPEDLARAFMRERLEKASLLERLGAIQPDIAVKDDNIRSLEEDKIRLTSEIEKLKQQPATVSAGDPKAKSRLERQKTLAVKETEYLRAQLKALDAEESEMNPDRYQASQIARISELESLVDQYRQEVDTMHKSMTQLESSQPPMTPTNVGIKRPLEESSDERVGELLRKQRSLQGSVTESQTRITVLESELKAKSAQLSSLRSSSRLRVLELKDNPTATAATIKKSQLDALQSENETLRSQLSGQLPTVASDGSPDSSLVPQASLTRLELTLAEKDAIIASRDKSLVRLKDIFRSKGLEFKEAVYSLLGWHLNFQPNGKVKATNMFYPSSSSGTSSRRTRSAKTAESASAEEEHFIEFDGENGTMKVSGGPQSEFAKEIRSLIEFWVDGKGQVPCFLAAMTLEFYDKYGDASATTASSSARK
jgi:mitotic spindle assembly checkpoint protein MAD1